jgi:hypothetical protein
VDGSGSYYAIWLQRVGIVEQLWGNRFSHVSESWSEPVRIDRVTGRVSEPQLAVNSRGEALAVWVQGSAGKNSIWYNKYSQLAMVPAWREAALVEDDNDWPASMPRVSLADNGNATVIWKFRVLGVADNVYVNDYTAGSGWITSGGTYMSNSAGVGEEIRSLAVSRNGAGDVVILSEVMREVAGSEVETMWATYNTASRESWMDTIPWALNETSHGTMNPQVMMDEEGNAYAQFINLLESTDLPILIPVVLVRYYDHELPSSVLPWLDLTDSMRPFNLGGVLGCWESQLAHAKNGTDMVVSRIFRQKYDGTVRNVIRARLLIDHSWPDLPEVELFESEPIDPGLLLGDLLTGQTFPLSPDLAMGDNGQAVAVWIGDGDVYAKRFK